jgi:hypothetical protein
MDIDTDEQFQKLELQIKDLQDIVEQLCPHKELYEDPTTIKKKDNKYYASAFCKVCKKFMGRRESV